MYYNTEISGQMSKDMFEKLEEFVNRECECEDASWYFDDDADKFFISGDMEEGDFDDILDAISKFMKKEQFFRTFAYKRTDGQFEFSCGKVDSDGVTPFSIDEMLAEKAENVLGKIKTPLGEIVVERATDPENPGVSAMLDRGKDFAPMEILLAECQIDKDDEKKSNLVTHVWGDGMDEEPTEKITHGNVDEFFASQKAEKENAPKP